MKKIINTIKYGSTKTKAVLLLTFLSAIGILACLVCLLVWREMLFLFGAIVCTFLLLSLIQTFGIEQESPIEPDAKLSNKVKPEKPEKSKKTMKVKKSERSDEPEQPEKPKKSKKLKKSKRKNKPEKSKRSDESEKPVKPEKSKRKNKQEKSEKPEKLEKSKKSRKIKKSERSDESEKAEEQKEKSKDSEVQDIKPLTEETVEVYDRKKIKKVMHRYKVKRDHRLILIDHSEKLHIRQTPAYFWLEGKAVHFLLIEEEPRHISIPRHKFSSIVYLKKQMANENADYAALKGKSILAELFRPYLPDYSHSTVVDDLSAYKNLYGIGDVFVTNRSARALFDLLGLEFKVNDRVTMSNKANMFFKDAYKANILLRDNVIDANGYADQISNVLDDMAHSAISYAEFKDTLNLMTRNKLITQEFATYYMDVRNNLTN